ncbi:transposase family protein [Rathayibacter toxicus]|uniref:transposase family protein n=2 Tax=Rathayibacter toxicus TaxID=145458 RepID=UPI000A417124|nr:transposase family protein [Rathayibacter toxicus]QWL26502.1 transposase family protein [Rathayibacter toxicus]QWL30699.1 transposase family protein [Rathayibacter toxicus]QWL51611.1 transposase family protein [Rathayibacter toxicus]
MKERLVRLVDAGFMWSKPGTRPRALSLNFAACLTLAYFRNNVTDKLLAAFFGVSQRRCRALLLISK